MAHLKPLLPRKHLRHLHAEGSAGVPLPDGLLEPLERRLRRGVATHAPLSAGLGPSMAQGGQARRDVGEGLSAKGRLRRDVPVQMSRRERAAEVKRA